MRTTSVGHAAVGSPGDPRRTIPEPAAMAPRVHRTAAPSMPADPAATPTAFVHLFTPRSRPPTNAATSASSMSEACGAANPIPMSATSTVPLCAGPAPWSSPGLSAAKVTVRSALTASPEASPVSASTPEGMSIARTAAPVAPPAPCTNRGSPSRTRRRSPGRTPGAGAVSDRRSIQHRDAGAAPLQHAGGDPAVGPVAALARRPRPPGARRRPRASPSAARATAVPARRTRVSCETSASAAASAARISSRVRTARTRQTPQTQHAAAAAARPGPAPSAPPCSATTKAMATSSVWVNDRWKRSPRAPASSAAVPFRTT